MPGPSSTHFELPVFPLTGSLLLPGCYLPLNIFEPRYKALVRDCLESDRRFGMVQPRLPQPDNLGPVRGLPEVPEIYAVGCVGEIGEWELETDGRYLIVLKGVERFEVVAEIAGSNGYRRVLASSARFACDSDADAGELDPAPLLEAVAALAESGRLDFDMDVLAALPPLRLLNGLSAALPFAPAEKQALLEAATAADRLELLLAILRMELLPSRRPAYVEPAVN